MQRRFLFHHRLGVGRKQPHLLKHLRGLNRKGAERYFVSFISSELGTSTFDPRLRYGCLLGCYS